MSDFYYHTTSVSGNDKDMPTPIELKLNQDERGFHLTVKGTNGDQVTEAVSTVLRKMPASKDTGLTTFLTGLAAISAIFAMIAAYAVSSTPNLTPTQNTGELIK